MKKLLAAIAIITAFWSAPAMAQCNGKFGAATFCGTVAGGPPGPVPASSIPGLLTLPNAEIYVGNSGGLAAPVAMSKDCTITNTGAITCLSTNGVAFSALATQSSVLSSQLPSPFTNGTVQSNTGFFATYTNNTPIVNNHIALGDGSGGLKDGGGSTGMVTSIACGTGLSCSPSPIISTGTVTNSGVVTVKKQVFTSSGTYTPSTGMLFAMIECQGSGAGGGGVAGASGGTAGGGGGGSGGYSRVLVSAATVGASQTVTVGAAGAAGTAGANAGGNGAAVSVGTLCVANGGSGGGGSTANTSAGGTNGAGGTAGTGDLAIPGTAGGFGNAAANTALALAGNGAPSYFGGGVSTQVLTGSGTAAGVGATGAGAGGSGADTNNSASNTAGGAGSKGVVYITEYNSQ